MQNKKEQQAIIGVDPGNVTSGILVVVNCEIIHAENVGNEKVFDVISKYIGKGHFEGIVVIEDMMPYTIRLTPEVIATCKYIGELSYRLQEAHIASQMINRSDVKKWVFDKYRGQVFEKIEAKILQRKKFNKDGEPRKPSFIYVDDRIVITAMKYHWGIETPKPGKVNRFGISKHAWQALGAVTYYLSSAKYF